MSSSLDCINNLENNIHSLNTDDCICNNGPEYYTNKNHNENICLCKNVIRYYFFLPLETKNIYDINSIIFKKPSKLLLLYAYGFFKEYLTPA